MFIHVYERTWFLWKCLRNVWASDFMIFLAFKPLLKFSNLPPFSIFILSLQLSLYQIPVKSVCGWYWHAIKFPISIGSGSGTNLMIPILPKKKETWNMSFLQSHWFHTSFLIGKTEPIHHSCLSANVLHSDLNLDRSSFEVNHISVLTQRLLSVERLKILSVV